MKPYRICPALCAVLLSFLVFSKGSAQIRLAALGGIQSTDLLQKNSIPGFDTSSGNYYSSKTGFELGFLAEIPLGKSFFLQPGILFSSKGNQYERIYDSSVYHTDTIYNQHTLNLSYVEIPMYLTYKIALSKTHTSHFYISAGPYFAFINGASQDYQNRVLPYNATKYLYSTGTEDLPVGSGVGKYKTFDMGIAAKAGFELGNVLIGAYFSHGFSNAYTAAYPSSFHNQVFGGSIGIWLNKGKPALLAAQDTDKDGTPDASDSCRTIPGTPKYHGCPIPDSDLDGMNDESDSCKTVPGLFRYQGCPVPDTDKDGVNDEADSCKYVPGPAAYYGCPIPDRDHDGVNDEIDKCPNQPGPADHEGCPVIPAEMVKRSQWVAANIKFQLNSTKLTRGSYPAIQELADSLKANPNLVLEIDGYTDNTGKPAYNRKLSLERASEVKKALLKTDVEASRISVKGLGDSAPVADNKTAAGRAENRRVVFIFQLKNR